MKYYQILYNSSQSQRDGGVGFGIRAVSKDLPEEYIAPIVAAGYFVNYEAGSFPPVSAKDLFENTTKILDYPLQYSYTTLNIQGGKCLYILKRCIPLGFDYAYYKSGIATRLGNYSVHLLIFEKEPNPSIFNLLYEQTSANSAYFIPKQRIPDNNSEELKWLMLDQMPPLEPTSNIVVESRYSDSISITAYNLFFFYIEAIKQKKSLIVQIKDRDKNVVIADLYRLMDEYAAKVTFVSGIYSQSINTSINITFINEYYIHPLALQGSAYIKCNAIDVPDTDEYKKYYSQLLNAVQSNDCKTMQKISRWLLSGDYSIVSDCDEQTAVAFFNYCQDPDKFTMKDACNKVLIDLIVNKVSNKQYSLLNQRHAELLLKGIAEENITNLCYAMQLIHYSKKKGIDITSILNSCKQKCCDYILIAPSQMILIYEKLDKEVFDLFVVKDSFAKCADFIKDQEIIPHLKKVYKYFFLDPKNSINELLSLLLRRIAPAELAFILRDANPSVESRINLYVTKIQKHPIHVKKLWELVIADIGPSVKIDIFKEFKDQHHNPDFADIFYFALQNNSHIITDNFLISNSRLMDSNPAYKKLVIAQEKNYKIYQRLFGSFLSCVTKEKSKRLIETINTTVLVPFDNSKDVVDWQYLCDLLEGKHDKVERLYDIAKRIKDKTYFEQLAYKYLDLTKKSESTVIKTIITDLRQANLFDEKKFMNYVFDYEGNKQTVCIGIYCKDKKFSFDKALSLTQNLSFYSGDDVLKTYYAKEYSSYLKKQRISNFFKKLFGFSKDEKRVSKSRKNKK